MALMPAVLASAALALDEAHLQSEEGSGWECMSGFAQGSSKGPSSYMYAIGGVKSRTLRHTQKTIFTCGPVHLGGGNRNDPICHFSASGEDQVQSTDYYPSV